MKKATRLCAVLLSLSSILPFSTLLSSCLLFHNGDNTKDDKNEIVKYVPNTAWKLNVSGLAYWDNFSQYDNFYYILEKDLSDSNRNNYFYTKIDLRDGTRVWSTQKLYGSARCSPIQYTVDDKKYLITGKNNSIIKVFDDETGDLAASVIFCKDEEERSIYGFRMDYWHLVDEYLYWANSSEKGNSGLVNLDLSFIDFSKDPQELQYKKPEIVWENKEVNQSIFTHPVEKDGIIYFITFNQFRNDDFCVLGAYDTKNKSVVWQRKSEKLSGYGQNNMCIVNDRLYIIQEAQGCYNLETGKPYWENYQSLEERHKEVGIDASMYSTGITYWNGNFYFTNSGSWSSSHMTGIDNKYIKNIQCIDAETGKYIWGDLPEGSGSLDTRPIILKDKCYVVCWDEIRVYNPITGELLGVDDSIHNMGNDRNAVYDDMIIFFDINYEDGSSVLTAIKVD